MRPVGPAAMAAMLESGAPCCSYSAAPTWVRAPGTRYRSKTPKPQVWCGRYLSATARLLCLRHSTVSTGCLACLQDRAAFTRDTQAPSTDGQLVCARCSRGVRPAVCQAYPFAAYSPHSYTAVLLVQGTSGAQSSKGSKKGKKGADAAAPAGASTVSSGIKLENVRLASCSSTVPYAIGFVQDLLTPCHLQVLAVIISIVGTACLRPTAWLVLGSH